MTESIGRISALKLLNTKGKIITMKIPSVFRTACMGVILVSNSAFSEDLPIIIEHPIYRDGTLYIPRVDTERHAGQYSDATLQFDSASGMWQLRDYFDVFPLEGGSMPLLEPEKLEIIVTNSSPVQVFLKASVKFVDGCIRYGQISQRRVGNTFEVVMPIDHGIHAAVVCADSVIDEKVIPLQVYGLPAGTYDYIFNGQQTGTFTLSKDNTL